MKDIDCVVKIVDKVSKSGNAYSTAEVWVGSSCVKSNIFLNDAEKTLFSILAK